MERKDNIISNLTSAVYRQRDKIELMRNFCNWRIQHNDAKREVGLQHDSKREVGLQHNDSKRGVGLQHSDAKRGGFTAQ